MLKSLIVLLSFSCFLFSISYSLQNEFELTFQNDNDILDDLLDSEGTLVSQELNADQNQATTTSISQVQEVKTLLREMPTKALKSQDAVTLNSKNNEISSSLLA